MTTFKNLIGHRINGMFITKDHRILLFRTINGKIFEYNTSADCCNSVWINHLSGTNCLGDHDNSFDLLKGALVTGAEDKGWTENRYNENGNEAVQDGFWTISTDRGYIDIEVRNSHNGYYGGKINENDEDERNLSEYIDLKQITEDF